MRRDLHPVVLFCYLGSQEMVNAQARQLECVGPSLHNRMNIISTGIDRFNPERPNFKPTGIYNASWLLKAFLRLEDRPPKCGRRRQRLP